MEKRHRCKLCLRSFANGRALGGHMRSHMMKFYDEAKKKQQYDDNNFRSIHSFSSMLSSSSSSSSSSSEEEIEGVKEGLVDHGDFYVAVTLQDRESETESSMKTATTNRVRKSRRSKRVSKSRISDFDGFFQVKKKSKLDDDDEHDEKRKNQSLKNSYDQSSLSSISDTTPEEHVAHCLIMLSRDKWGRADVEFHGGEDDFAGGDGNQFGVSGVRKAIKSKVRGKYRCEECNKLFKSYQALGGHRASHKKVRAEGAAAPPCSGGAPKAARSHECPFCQRVFSSGQALGGHKRSHFTGPGAISGNVGNTGAIVQNSRINGEIHLDIDLNLPAPMDDEENSHIAVSAVSDAEFFHPTKL